MRALLHGAARRGEDVLSGMGDGHVGIAPVPREQRLQALRQLKVVPGARAAVDYDRNCPASRARRRRRVETDVMQIVSHKHPSAIAASTSDR